MIRTRIFRSICTTLLAFLFGITFLPSANGQGDIGKQIQDAFNKGDYESTAKLAEQYLKDYEGAEDTGSALYFSGLGHFLIKKYPIAVFRLQAATDFESTPADIKEAALYDLGRALVAYSENLTPELLKIDQDFRKAAPIVKNADGSPKAPDKFTKTVTSASAANIKAFKEAIINQAIATYDRLVTTYPNSLFVPDVMQSKAIILIQRGNYEQAEKEFEALSNLPSAASMKDDVDFLLGWLYGQRAEKFRADYEDKKADEYIAKARAIYERLSASDNLATSNDSLFQLASLDFTAGKYESAIQRFHAVMPKAAVIAAQTERLTLISSKIKGMEAGDEKKALQRDFQHERDKLEKIKSGSDLSIDALVRIGNAFLQNKKPDEARTIYRYSLNFAEGDEQKGITIQMIISYALQGATADASKLFDDFKGKYPKDPMSEAINYYIGRALMQQAGDPKSGNIDKNKVQQAIDHFNTNLKEFPGARVAPEIIKLIGQCYQMLGQPDKAVEVYNKFIDDVKSKKIVVAPEAFEDAERLMALALFKLDKKDDALKLMGDLRSTAKTPDIQELAYYTYADFLQRMDNKEEAAKAIDEFVAKFPHSQNAPLAFYTRAKTLFALAKGDSEKSEAAAQAFRDVYTKYPNDKVAQAAYDAVWKVYKAAKISDKMAEAQNIFLAKFPFAPEAVDILGGRAKEILTNPDNHPATEEDRIALEDKAIEAYGKALEVYTKATNTPGATITSSLKESAASSQLAVGDIYQRRERAMGPYKSMTDDIKKNWYDITTKALDAYKNAVRIAPATTSSSTALVKMNDTIKDMINFGKIDMEGGLKIFVDLATEPAIIKNPSAKNQIMIVSSGLPYDQGMIDRAASILEDVFKNLDPSVPIKWEDLERYGAILITQKKYDAAEKIYEHLKEEFGKYRATDGTDKDNPHVLASYTYGKAICAANLGRSEESEQYFATLEKDYKWSPKYAESMLFRAEILFNSKKIDEALKQLVDASEFPNSSKETKAKALNRIGELLQQLGDTYNGPILKDQKGEPRKGQDGKPINATTMAYNYYNQVDLFYGDALPELTAQALIRAAEIDQQRGNKEKEKKILEKIIKRYANTTSLNKARDMLSTLP